MQQMFFQPFICIVLKLEVRRVMLLEYMSDSPNPAVHVTSSVSTLCLMSACLVTHLKLSQQ